MAAPIQDGEGGASAVAEIPGEGGDITQDVVEMMMHLNNSNRNGLVMMTEISKMMSMANNSSRMNPGKDEVVGDSIVGVEVVAGGEEGEDEAGASRTITLVISNRLQEMAMQKEEMLQLAMIQKRQQLCQNRP